MVKPLIWSKILVNILSHPFVSFHLPWNDDAMVEVFLESLELWFGTAVVQMPGSKKKDNCCFMLRSRGFYSIKQCVTHKRKIPLKTKKSTSNFRYLNRPFYLERLFYLQFWYLLRSSATLMDHTLCCTFEPWLGTNRLLTFDKKGWRSIFESSKYPLNTSIYLFKFIALNLTLEIFILDYEYDTYCSKNDYSSG